MKKISLSKRMPPLQLTLVVGSSFFTLYLLSFMFVHFVPFYLTAALMGVGFAREFTFTIDLHIFQLFRF